MKEIGQIVVIAIVWMAIDHMDWLEWLIAHGVIVVGIMLVALVFVVAPARLFLAAWNSFWS
jgi:hypothetical protein